MLQDLDRIGPELLLMVTAGCIVLADVLLQRDRRRPRPVDHPADPVAPAARQELVVEAGLLRARRDQLPEVVGDLRRAAVERDRDRLDQRRLAGACRPGDGEQIQTREVEIDLVGECGEPLDPDPKRSHARPPRRAA